jgi:hypothetical protein
MSSSDSEAEPQSDDLVEDDSQPASDGHVDGEPMSNSWTPDDSESPSDDEFSEEQLIQSPCDKRGRVPVPKGGPVGQATRASHRDDGESDSLSALEDPVHNESSGGGDQPPVNPVARPTGMSDPVRYNPHTDSGTRMHRRCCV